MSVKVDLNTKALDFDGEPVQKARTEEHLRLRDIFITALTAQFRQTSGEKQVEQFDLALKLKNTDGEYDFSNKEAAMLEELVASAFTPLITGQVIKILEGIDPFALAED